MFKRLILMTLIAIGICMPLSSSTATGVGDVTIKIHPMGSWPNSVYTCFNQVFEIWIKNDAPLYEVSLGLALSCSGGPIAFQNYGTLPVGDPVLRIDDPASMSAFDDGLTIEYSQDPDLLFIRGVATQTPLPVHNVSTRIYSFMIDASQTFYMYEEHLCIENIVNPATGIWGFTDIQDYAPTYCGAANNSTIDPSAAAFCPWLFFVPCMPPELTVVPESTVTIGCCDTFSFQFDYLSKAAKCGFVGPEDAEFSERAGHYGMWFARKGTISDFGFYQFRPALNDTIIVDTISIYDAGCSDDEFILTLNITHTVPQFTRCNQLLRVQSGTSREVSFNVTDPDLCESRAWTLEQLAPTAPQSTIAINPETGIVTVDANPLDIGTNFGYRVVCTDQSGKSVSCEFALEILNFVPGDADGNGILTISDVVWLINYIFGGPGGEEIPIDRVDSDCNLMCNISDAVFLINYIFAGGPEPC